MEAYGQPEMLPAISGSIGVGVVGVHILEIYVKTIGWVPVKYLLVNSSNNGETPNKVNGNTTWFTTDIL